ncbi:uncharacterized protein [Musca autumnalis]|uniref:uncharacterized protein n=1 Tax=Musca autumnalis TaxID=221902 RepID=UPI003CECBFE9
MIAPGNSSEDELLASSQELVASQLSVVSSANSCDSLQQQNTNKTATLSVKKDGQTTEPNLKKKSPSDVRKSLYQKAKFILGKIAKNAANGTVDERDEADKLKYTQIVEEYEKAKISHINDRQSSSKRERSRTEDTKPAKRKKLKHNTTTSSTTKRPFNEVVKDNMLVAIANEKEGKLSPITTAEWGTVETKLSELVMEHVLANEDSPVPHFDSSEVHRGYRVIKCMDEYSKEFLEKSIAKLSNAWDDISLKLIPAQEIPMRPRARVWLPKIECDGPKLLKCLAKMNKDVPMDEWSVIATEPPNNNSMSLVLSITEAGVEALERLGNKLFFGIREAKVKILRPHGPNGEDDEADIDDAGMLLDNMQLEGPPTSSPNKNDV